jgi:hypothetical protein
MTSSPALFRPVRPGHRPARVIEFSSTVLAGLLILLACATSHAQLTTLAYDSFGYSTGSLSGRNGGTGWSSPWTNDYTSGASFTINATGMSYSGLVVSGGKAAWGSGGNGISEDSRTLPLVDTGIVYIQFLSQFGSSSGGGTPNLRLFESGTLTGGFGGNGGTYGAFISILNASLNPAAGGSSSSSARLSSLNLVVVQIDYQADTTMMWVDPNLSTFDYENPGTPNATYSGLAPAFDSVSIDSRSPASFDELSILEEPIPEPTATLLLSLGLAALAIGVRLDKRSR